MDFVENKEGGLRDVGQLGKKPWLLLVAAAALMLVALLLLMVTAPSPTVLSVRIVDSETGTPVSDAVVWARSQTGSELPAIRSDQSGIARFDDVPPESPYLIRIQRIDYDFLFEPGVIVPEGQETALLLSLPPNAGGRLFVGLDQAGVVEIDTASLLVVQTRRLPDWKKGAVDHLRIHPTDDLLYAIAGEEGCILGSLNGELYHRFEAYGMVETLSTDGTHLHLVRDSNGLQEASAGAGQIQVGQSVSGQFLTLDAYTAEQLASAPVYSPFRSPIVIWKPDEDGMYLVAPSDRSVWLLRQGRQDALIRLSIEPYPQEGFRSADGHYRYAWSGEPFEELRATFGDDLKPILTGQLPFSGLASFAVSPTSQDLYILDAQLGALSILDPVGSEPPILVAVGKQPVAIAVSPGGLWGYVANRDSHTISVIYLPSATVVQTIAVDGEPLSLAVR